MASETSNNEDKFREELNWCIEYLELKLPNVGEKQGKKKKLHNYFKMFSYDDKMIFFQLKIFQKVLVP